MNGTPFFHHPGWRGLHGDRDVKQLRENDSLIAALKIMVLGETDRMQRKGISAVQSRAQLVAARQRRK